MGPNPSGPTGRPVVILRRVIERRILEDRRLPSATMAGNHARMSHEHCCKIMVVEVNRSCPDHSDRFDCPDCLISYTARFREYGIIVHDGGTSNRAIEFCPWCGATLPQSERDRWFSELERRGIDPSIDTVPDTFRDERWLETS